jgi:hypothetical protein
MGSGSPSAEHGITMSSPASTLNSTGPAGGKLGGSIRNAKNSFTFMIKEMSNEKQS